MSGFSIEVLSGFSIEVLSGFLEERYLREGKRGEEDVCATRDAWYVDARMDVPRGCRASSVRAEIGVLT